MTKKLTHRLALEDSDSEASDDMMSQGSRTGGWIQRCNRSASRSRHQDDGDDDRESQVREAVVRGQQEWRSRSGASGKALVVLCIYPECTAKVMFTQSFANHFRAQHGNGHYARDDRDRYERAIDDPALYHDSTQMTRVLQHRLQNQELGLQQLSQNVGALNTTVENLRRDVALSTSGASNTQGLARAIEDVADQVRAVGLGLDRKISVLYDSIVTKTEGRS